MENLEPDILLSIGTGKSSRHLAKEAEKLEKQKDDSRLLNLMPKVFRIVFARMNDILDSERTWDRFFINVIQHGSSQRYIRINPELSTIPPALDDKEKLLSLEADVRQSLAFKSGEIRGVADRLVASCFYFEKANVQPVEEQTTGLQYCPTVVQATDTLLIKGKSAAALRTELITFGILGFILDLSRENHLRRSSLSSKKILFQTLWTPSQSPS